jgi:ferritin-like metal-binding protein YciE
LRRPPRGIAQRLALGLGIQLRTDENDRRGQWNIAMPGQMRSLFNKEAGMTTKEDRLLEWLRNAHAMEKQAETMLTAQAGRIETYPDLKARIEEHLAGTRRQGDVLQACIERRGGDTSTLKDLMGKFAAMGQGIGGAVMDDEVIKGSMASYTFEHMEIATYQVLIATAEACGDLETKGCASAFWPRKWQWRHGWAKTCRRLRLASSAWRRLVHQQSGDHRLCQ